MNDKDKHSLHQTTGQEGITDFFVIFDFKKFRGVKVVEAEDADGDFGRCVLVPLLKNGIPIFKKNMWRMILSARRSHYEENASHVLVPLVEDCVQRAMVAKGFFRRYVHSAPIVGDIVPDLTRIPRPPVFKKGSAIEKDVLAHRTENPKGGATSVTQDTDGKINNRQETNKTSDAQQRFRDKILSKLKK